MRTAVGPTLAKEPNIVATTEVQWKGTVYKKRLLICLRQGKSAEFGQIEFILVKKEKHVYFINTFHDVSYWPEFGLYEVKEARSSIKCRKAELNVDYSPLPVYELFGTRVISLKRSIVDTQ